MWMYPPLRPPRSLLPGLAENKATEFLAAWRRKIKMAGKPSLPAVKSLNLPLGRNHEAIQNRTAPASARLLRRAASRSFVLLDAQVVLHREDARHAVGRDEGARRVAFIRRDAFERHIAVLDDDVNRRNGLDRQPVETGLAIDRAVDRDANPVVEVRKR